MKSKFSVIIPVFNAAAHLRECLDSVLAQSVAEWECICVNDGSSDESEGILDAYAKTDSRFRVINMKKNGGVSVARNAGLDVAKGEYVGFVDADDILSVHWLEAVRDSATTNTDMIKLSVSRKLPFPKYSRTSQIQELFGRDVFDFSILRGGLTVQNFYRRVVLRDVRFRGGMKVYEDAIFNLDALLNVQRAVKCNFAGYWYRDSETSAWRRRTVEDIERLISEMQRWYVSAQTTLHEANADSLAKQRLAGYVTAIVLDYIANAGIVDVKNAAKHLPPKLQSLENTLCTDMSMQMDKGRMKSVKRFAYQQFIRRGQWCPMWMMLSAIRKLKEACG